MQMIRVEWPADQSAADTWERLRQRAPTESLFLTPEWLGSWCRHLGSGRPMLFGVADESEVIALAPIDRVWVGGLAVLRPLGLGVTDYFDMLLPRDEEKRRAALAHRPARGAHPRAMNPLPPCRPVGATRLRGTPRDLPDTGPSAPSGGLYVRDDAKRCVPARRRPPRRKPGAKIANRARRANRKFSSRAWHHASGVESNCRTRRMRA